MKVIASFFSFILLTSGIVNAQQSIETKNPYVQLGNKALMDGDFKSAVTHLEKSMPDASNNADVLYMLAYSYYHSNNYAKAISTFGQVVSLKPNQIMAYYYRGKARNILGSQMNSTLTPAEREKLLLASIKDYTKALEISTADQKASLYYQNRAISYRDYAILKSQKNSKIYDKLSAQNYYKLCINDLQYVLDANPGRKDIMDEMKKAKVYMANIE
ncbi:MAG: tetratricopeptide repeat protein [Pyrinomonadaceae bacterium]|nr:tetratricopeptide repeat protein [Sphingobacteriaceae bacterium]